jgi:Mrp family chromosome partitioning ATPase
VGHDHHKKKRMDIPEDKIGNGITNNINKVIGIASGKGGVGKSSVTALIAVALNKKGYKVGILDADLTGPSIPRLFGVNAVPEKMELGVLPVKSRDNIIIMSINLLLENKDDPVLWRGPILSGVIKQFWDEVIWAHLDFLLIDLPPGTGDIPLTVMQSIPVDEIVMVTGPQDVTNMVVKKAVRMMEKMDVPILGVVENMAYISCPGCNEVIKPFGESYANRMAEESSLELIASLGIDSEFIALANEGKVEDYNGENLEKIGKVVEKLI